MNLTDIFFIIFSLIAFSSALLVVFIQDLFKSALMLVVTFISVGGIFFLLNAEFLGVIQILIYAGGIAIIIIFGVLMTKDMANKIVYNAKLRNTSICGATETILFHKKIVKNFCNEILKTLHDNGCKIVGIVF